MNINTGDYNCTAANQYKNISYQFVEAGKPVAVPESKDAFSETPKENTAPQIMPKPNYAVTYSTDALKVTQQDLKGYTLTGTGLSSTAGVASSIVPQPASPTIFSTIANLFTKAAETIKNVFKTEVTSSSDVAAQKVAKLKEQFETLNIDEETKQFIRNCDASGLELYRSLNSVLNDKIMDTGLVKDSKLTLTEAVAIRAYTAGDVHTGSIYQIVNKALREQDEAAIEKFKPFTDTLTSALNKLPAQEKTVYRGMYNVPVETLNTYTIGGTVKYDSFTSTSMLGNLKVFDGNVYITIDPLKKSDKTESNGKDISALSYYQNEGEVLFAPGSKFMILSHTEKANSGKKGNKHYIHMAEVSDGE